MKCDKNKNKIQEYGKDEKTIDKYYLFTMLAESYCYLVSNIIFVAGSY